ncbi:MAG TPA: archease [Myxococcales bacterium]|jgi:SHS2 domain-containing protein|nr:archease [Myxococcales bacterium]
MGQGRSSQATPAHSFTEHTSEVRVRLTAPTFGGLLGEAGRALAELLADEEPGPLQAPERVSLQGADRVALLVHWLNELVFLSETRKQIYAWFDVQVATDREVVAQVRGWAASRVRTQVKAATFHGLAVAEGPEGLQAEVVLDV